MKIKNVAQVVKEILEEFPKTRDNDNLLLCYVVWKYGYNYKDSFVNILKLMDNKKLPAIVSVVRARRKAQELYPNLRASQEVEEKRNGKIAEYKDFSKEKEI